MNPWNPSGLPLGATFYGGPIDGEQRVLDANIGPYVFVAQMISPKQLISFPEKTVEAKTGLTEGPLFDHLVNEIYQKEIAQPVGAIKHQYRIEPQYIGQGVVICHAVYDGVA